MVYKQIFLPFSTTIKQDMVVRVSDGVFIPFDPANTDYQTFKIQILSDEAQLGDTTGVVMSPDEAKQFVTTLP